MEVKYSLMALIWILTLTIFSALYITDHAHLQNYVLVHVLIQLYLVLTAPLNAFILLWFFLINF